jgi:adenylosuccinate synthase
MSVHIVVGTGFGDEGKGKAIDYLAQNADLVVRFQGGDNAGHTVVNDKGVFKLHLVPCGIFNPSAICLVGTGMVINPDVLIGEMEMLESRSVSVAGLRISDKAHILFPYHVLLDEGRERRFGIGTTKRGIGPAYASKYARSGLRMGDLLNLEKWEEKAERGLFEINAQLAAMCNMRITSETILQKLCVWSKKLSKYICNAGSLIQAHLDNGNILFEGQLGLMKDIDLGIYPFVTSSHTAAAYAAVSGGFPARKIDRISGVAKAFVSAVGEGPFVSEMSEAEGAVLRGTSENPDDEYGARTGRKRRLGWLDIPMLQYAHSINGFDDMILTKLDKLDGLDTVKVCVGYQQSGEYLDGMPDTETLYQAEPVYKELSGWSGVAGCRSYDELPENAKAYIAFIEKEVGVPIKIIGNGPAREDMLVR